MPSAPHSSGAAHALDAGGSSRRSVFREAGLAWDKRVTSRLAATASAFLVVTAPAALSLIGDPQRIQAILAVRALCLAATVAALYCVRRVATPRAYDAIITGWLGIWFVGIVVENALLPTQFTGFVWWDVFLVVVVYAATPLTFTRQAVLGAVISVGDLLVLWMFKTTDDWFSLLDVSLAYACANVVGTFLSHAHHSWRRRTFLALRHEIARPGQTCRRPWARSRRSRASSRYVRTVATCGPRPARGNSWKGTCATAPRRGSLMESARTAPRHSFQGCPIRRWRSHRTPPRRRPIHRLAETRQSVAATHRANSAVCRVKIDTPYGA